MVDLERASVLGEISVDVYISVEPGGKTAGATRQDSGSACGAEAVERPAAGGCTIHAAIASSTDAVDSDSAAAEHPVSACRRVGSIDPISSCGVGIAFDPVAV